MEMTTTRKTLHTLVTAFQNLLGEENPYLINECLESSSRESCLLRTTWISTGNFLSERARVNTYLAAKSCIIINRIKTTMVL